MVSVLVSPHRHHRHRRHRLQSLGGRKRRMLTRRPQQFDYLIRRPQRAFRSIAHGTNNDNTFTLRAVTASQLDHQSPLTTLLILIVRRAPRGVDTEECLRHTRTLTHHPRRRWREAHVERELTGSTHHNTTVTAIQRHNSDAIRSVGWSGGCSHTQSERDNYITKCMRTGIHEIKFVSDNCESASLVIQIKHRTFIHVYPNVDLP